MDNTNEIEMFSPEEMLSPFDALKETDGEGREWWNSRKLARLMGYQKYWNFERLRTLGTGPCLVLLYTYKI